MSYQGAAPKVVTADKFSQYPSLTKGTSTASTMPPSKSASDKGDPSAPEGGVDLRDAAVDYLGPFRFRTKADAQRHHVRSGEGTILPYIESYETAVARVEELARQFKIWEALEKEYQRVSAILRDLDRLAECSRGLWVAMVSTHWSTWDRAHAGGTSNLNFVQSGVGTPRADDAERQLFREAHGNGLPAGRYTQAVTPGETTWVDRLKSLEQWIQLTRQNFIATFGSGDVGKPDPGGRSSIFSQFGGTAKWRLARSGFMIFDGARPGKASTTEYGDFHRFLLAIVAYATGQQDRAGILDHARRIIRIQRRMRAIALRQGPLAVELQKASHEGTARAAEAKSLKSEWDELNQEEFRLAEELLADASWRPSRRQRGTARQLATRNPPKAKRR